MVLRGGASSCRKRRRDGSECPLRVKRYRSHSAQLPDKSGIIRKLCLSNRPGDLEKPRGEGRDKFVLSETGRPVIDRSGDKVVETGWSSLSDSKTSSEQLRLGGGPNDVFGLSVGAA